MYEIVIADAERRTLNCTASAIEDLARTLPITVSLCEGKDLLETILQRKPILVITDIFLDGMNGLEIISKSKKRHLPTHFLIVSAETRFEYFRAALLLDVDDFLQKPFQPLELKKSVFRILKNIKGSSCEKASFSYTTDTQTTTSSSAAKTVFSSDTCETLLNPSDQSCEITPSDLYCRHVQKAKDFIDTHYCEPLSLVSVASQIYINPTYLGSLFKKEVGISFTAYLTERRMETAKHLLRLGYTSTQTADCVGYSDVKYFRKVFQKKTGQSPVSFQKQNREKITLFSSR